MIKFSGTQFDENARQWEYDSAQVLEEEIADHFHI